jgi:hypothetical protein
MFNDILQVPLDHDMWYFGLFAWAIVWQGLALWKAAEKGQKWWFIAFMHTLGVLEILYIYVFSVDRSAKSSASKE